MMMMMEEVRAGTSLELTGLQRLSAAHLWVGAEQVDLLKPG